MTKLVSRFNFICCKIFTATYSLTQVLKKIERMCVPVYKNLRMEYDFEFPGLRIKGDVTVAIYTYGPYR